MNKEKQKKLILDIQGDLTPYELAELLGMSSVQFYRIRNGNRGISVKIAKKLSDLSGKSLDEILMI